MYCALNANRQIKRCKVYPSTNDLMIECACGRKEALKLLCETDPESAVVPEHALTSVKKARELKRQYTGRLVGKVAARYFRRWFIPKYIRIEILAVKGRIAVISARIQKLRDNIEICGSVKERAARLQAEYDSLRNETSEKEELSDELLRGSGGTGREDEPQRRGSRG